MRAVRLDNQDIIDTVLMVLNANDRLYGSNQNNILPLAIARGMGVIAMKVFAAGAMYGGAKTHLVQSRRGDSLSRQARWYSSTGFGALSTLVPRGHLHGYRHRED